MIEDPYFARIGAALREAAIFGPSLVIDLERLDRNIEIVRTRLATAGMPLRIVDKSLPCLPLLERIAAALGTDRFMTFHLPVGLAVLRAFPTARLLLGKPMPAGSVEAALRGPDGALAARIVWLIDTDERLHAYGALAERLGVELDVCFEVDVGLHRGGYPSPAALSLALTGLCRHPRLHCRGIMGYEAHIGHIPRALGGPVRALARATRRFAGFSARLKPHEREILNLGGSSTALLYDRRCGANEISLGSAFVKPSDFDVPSLAELAPAAFIATPILKVVDPLLPGLDRATWLLKKFGRFPERGCYLYGGRWLARPVSPVGMQPHPAMGSSTNQQFLALPRNSRAEPDDIAFLRPTQSEVVLQQFGPLAIYARGRIVDRWPVLAPM